MTLITTSLRYSVETGEIGDDLSRATDIVRLGDGRLALAGRLWLDVEAGYQVHGIDLVAEDGTGTRIELARDSAAAGQHSIVKVMPDGAGGARAVMSTYPDPDHDNRHFLDLYRIGPDGALTGDPVRIFDNTATPAADVSWLGQTDDGTILMGVIERGAPHPWGRYAAHVVQLDPDGTSAGPDLTLWEDEVGADRITSLTPLEDGGMAFAFTRSLYQPSGDFPELLMVGAVGPDGQPLFEPVEIARHNLFDTDAPGITAMERGPDGGITVFMGSRWGDDSAQLVTADGTLGPVVSFTDTPGVKFEARHALPDGTYVEIGSIFSHSTGGAHLVRLLDATGAPLTPFEPVLTSFGASFETLIDGEGRLVLYTPQRGVGFRFPDSPVSLAVAAVVDPQPLQSLTDGDDSFVLAAPGGVDGMAGNDTLTGSDGDDRIIGGPGFDLLQGGAGDDVIQIEGTDTVDGGAGFDTVVVTGVTRGAWQVRMLDGDSVLFAAAGVPARLDNIEELRVVFTDNLTITRSIGMIRSGGTEGNDVLQADDSGQLLESGPGADRLIGGAGNDTLKGGTGRDILEGFGGDDLIFGGAEDLDVDDTVYAGEGNDTVFGGAGNDLLFGMEGDDLLDGGIGGDFLAGQAGNDTLTGGAYGDNLNGNAGMDFLNGGFGHDRLNGGTEADVFFHLGLFGHGSDWIQDFSDAEGDRLQYGGTGPVSDFQVNLTETASAGQAGVQEAFVIHKPTGQILWALVDGAAQDHIDILIAGQSFDLLA